MGCNMCVVQKPEEQYHVMFQVSSKDLSKLSREQTLQALHYGRELRRSHRRKGGVTGGSGISLLADCVDSGTQTDISFQHLVTVGRNLHLASPPPPLPPIPEPYLLSQRSPLEHVYYEPTDYFDISHHDVDRQDDLEYEEVELFKTQQQEKLGLTVCYRTDDEEDLGIYVGEVRNSSGTTREQPGKSLVLVVNEEMSHVGLGLDRCWGQTLFTVLRDAPALTSIKRANEQMC